MSVSAAGVLLACFGVWLQLAVTTRGLRSKGSLSIKFSPRRLHLRTDRDTDSVIEGLEKSDDLTSLTECLKTCFVSPDNLKPRDNAEKWKKLEEEGWTNNQIERKREDAERPGFHPNGTFIAPVPTEETAYAMAQDFLYELASGGRREMSRVGRSEIVNPHKAHDNMLTCIRKTCFDDHFSGKLRPNSADALRALNVERWRFQPVESRSFKDPWQAVAQDGFDNVAKGYRVDYETAKASGDEQKRISVQNDLARLWQKEVQDSIGLLSCFQKRFRSLLSSSHWMHAKMGVHISSKYLTESSPTYFLLARALLKTLVHMKERVWAKELAEFDEMRENSKSPMIQLPLETWASNPADDKKPNQAAAPFARCFHEYPPRDVMRTALKLAVRQFSTPSKKKSKYVGRKRKSGEDSPAASIKARAEAETRGGDVLGAALSLSPKVSVCRKLKRNRHEVHQCLTKCFGLPLQPGAKLLTETHDLSPSTPFQKANLLITHKLIIECDAQATGDGRESKDWWEMAMNADNMMVSTSAASYDLSFVDYKHMKTPFYDHSGCVAACLYNPKDVDSGSLSVADQIKEAKRLIERAEKTPGLAT